MLNVLLAYLMSSADVETGNPKIRIAMVCMAAYGDYASGYIGTEISYSQGGYETGVVSRVAPEVEEVLMSAIRDLLD